MAKEGNAIHRYTNLPSLLYLLERKVLTLLDPVSWDDANDRHFMSLYKKAKELSCLSAICFSEADETYHHWRVFAGGPSGVRITFLRAPLLNLCTKTKGVRHNRVAYKLVRNTVGSSPEIQDLPFIKRYPYQQEDEYRFIFESKTELQRPVDIPLPLTLIRRVTLSPWISENVADAVRVALRCIPGCQKLKITRSTLIGNEDWKAFGNRALRPEKALRIKR